MDKIIELVGNEFASNYVTINVAVKKLMDDKGQVLLLVNKVIGSGSNVDRPATESEIIVVVSDVKLDML